MNVRKSFDRFKDDVVVVGEYAVETVYAAFHPEWRCSGARADEEDAALPGDDLVPEPNWTATRAASVRASPEQVWPWPVQMGYDRLVRTRVRFQPGWVLRLAEVLRSGDTVMQRAMLLGITRRAEAGRGVAVSSSALSERTGVGRS